MEIGSGCFGLGVGVSDWEWVFRIGSGCFGLGVGVSDWEWVFRIGSGCFGLGVGVSDWEWVFRIGSGCFELGVGVLDWEWVFRIGSGCFGLGVGVVKIGSGGTSAAPYIRDRYIRSIYFPKRRIIQQELHEKGRIIRSIYFQKGPNHTTSTTNHTKKYIVEGSNESLLAHNRL